MSLLKLSGVHTHYGHIHALKGLDLEVATGEVVTLIGANGAGKSTLMMTLFGAPRASAGRIVFEGEDITRLNPHEVSRRGIALVPEGRRIFPRMTVEENLRVGSLFRGKVGRDEFDRIYDLFPRIAERRAILLDRRGLAVGVSSLRADRLSDELVRLLAKGGYRTLTVASDAASQRLREGLKKNIKERHLKAAREKEALLIAAFNAPAAPAASASAGAASCPA